MSAKVSVIVCSRKEGDAQGLIDSLHDNPGLTTDEFEVIEVVGSRSMGAGYNEGIRLAADSDSHGFIFTHGDVEVWAGRKLWDNMLAEMLTVTGTGFVGVAGGSELPESLIWWEAPEKFGAVAHISQGLTYMSYFGPYGYAKVLDGVFLGCKRSVAQHLGPWMEDLDFHFYDIEMTYRAAAMGLRNHVVPLPMLHRSVGEIGSAWMESRKLVYPRIQALRKWGA